MYIDGSELPAAKSKAADASHMGHVETSTRIYFCLVIVDVSKWGRNGKMSDIGKSSMSGLKLLLEVLMARPSNVL